MKAFVSKIYPFFVSAASVLMSVFSGILLCSSLLGTCYSLDAIGTKLGVSKERARQTEADALRKLQKRSAGLGLEEFLTDE